MKRLALMLKKYSGDFAFTLGSSFVVAIATQLVLYPFLASNMSAEQYGVMLSLVGVWEILLAATGKELCNARLVCDRGKDSSGEALVYCKLLAVSSAIGSLVLAAYSVFAFRSSIIDVILLSVLIILSAAKAYTFVRFRINCDFKRLFASNCIASGGYLLGVFLFGLSGAWEIAFIVAELLALIYTLAVTKSRAICNTTADSKKIIGTYVNFSISSLIGGLGSSFDRVSIPFILGDEALSTYFASAFFGKIVFFISAPLRTVIVTYTGSGKVRLTRSTVLLANVFSILLVGIFVLLSWVLGDWATALLYPTLYLSAKPIILLANVAIILYLPFTINMSMLLGNSPAWIQPLFSSMRFVMYGVSAVGLSLYFGLVGYVVGMAVSNAAMGIISLIVCVYYVGETNLEKSTGIGNAKN